MADLSNSKLQKCRDFLLAIYYSSKSHKCSINNEICYKNVIVRKSRFGRGGFASKKFKKGETICFMEGRKVGLDVFCHVKAQNRNLLVDPLQIGQEEYIQLSEPYLFINHSCSPNAGIKRKNELFALRNIKKGEEIFYDYSTTIDEGVDCNCGSKGCRGKTGDFLMLPIKVQRKYLRMGAVPDFIKKKIKRKAF